VAAVPALRIAIAQIAMHWSTSENVAAMEAVLASGQRVTLRAGAGAMSTAALDKTRRLLATP